MVYLKSLVAGFAALIAVVLLETLGVIGWGLSIKSPAVNRTWVVPYTNGAPVVPHNNGASVAAHAISSHLPLLIIAGLIFVAGFYWEFRRATRINPR